MLIYNIYIMTYPRTDAGLENKHKVRHYMQMEKAGLSLKGQGMGLQDYSRFQIAKSIEKKSPYR